MLHAKNQSVFQKPVMSTIPYQSTSLVFLVQLTISNFRNQLADVVWFRHVVGFQKRKFSRFLPITFWILKIKPNFILNSIHQTNKKKGFQWHSKKQSLTKILRKSKVLLPREKVWHRTNYSQVLIHFIKAWNYKSVLNGLELRILFNLYFSSFINMEIFSLTWEITSIPLTQS